MPTVTPIKYDDKKQLHAPFGPTDRFPESFVEPDAETVPQYPRNHISPPLVRGKTPWLNDPQGPVWDASQGLWYLWYLYAEDEEDNASTSWREVTSPDLINWADQGVRLDAKDAPGGSFWSGCVIQDKDGRAGKGKGAWLYFITVQVDGIQKFVRYSAPSLGITPTYDGVEFSQSYSKAFRDPSVIYDGSRFLMVIACDPSMGGVARLVSDNAADWIIQDTYGLPDTFHTVECPQLLEIGNKWILLFGGNLDGYKEPPPAGVPQESAGDAPALTTHTFGIEVKYPFTSAKPIIDDFDKVNLHHLILDDGPDFYAGRAGKGPDGQYIMFGWLNNWNYAKDVQMPDFNGVLSTPRVMSLKKVYSDVDTTVCLTPVVKQSWKYTTSTAGLRLSGQYSPIPFLQVPEAYELNLSLTPIDGKTWPDTFGLYISPGDTQSYGFTAGLRGDNPRGPWIETTRNDFGTRAFGNGLKEWNEYYRTYITPTNALNITILVDKCSAEMFVNGVWAKSFLLPWPIGAQMLRMVVPEKTPLLANITLNYDRKCSAPIGALSRSHTDGLYRNIHDNLIGTFSNLFVKQVAQFAIDNDKGPFVVDSFQRPDESDDDFNKRKIFLLGGTWTDMSGNLFVLVKGLTDRVNALEKELTDQINGLEKELEKTNKTVQDLVDNKIDKQTIETMISTGLEGAVVSNDRDNLKKVSAVRFDPGDECLIADTSEGSKKIPGNWLVSVEKV